MWKNDTDNSIIGGPLFGIPDKQSARMDFDGTAHHSTLCIPVVPDSEPGHQLRSFPSTEVLSILGFGSFSMIPQLWDHLWAELDARGLEASGSARVIVLVAPYAGAHYKTKDYCYKYVVPIKERKA